MKENTPIIEVKGVGEKTQELFGKLNIHTAGELLACYPRDYEVFEEPLTVERLVPGEVCAVYAAVSGVISEK